MFKIIWNPINEAFKNVKNRYQYRIFIWVLILATVAFVVTKVSEAQIEMAKERSNHNTKVYGDLDDMVDLIQLRLSTHPKYDVIRSMILYAHNEDAIINPFENVHVVVTHEGVHGDYRKIKANWDIDNDRLMSDGLRNVIGEAMNRKGYDNKYYYIPDIVNAPDLDGGNYGLLPSSKGKSAIIYYIDTKAEVKTWLDYLNPFYFNEAENPKARMLFLLVVFDTVGVKQYNEGIVPIVEDYRDRIYNIIN